MHRRTATLMLPMRSLAADCPDWNIERPSCLLARSTACKMRPQGKPATPIASQLPRPAAS